MEWTGRRRRRSAAWIARRCATGFIASTLRGRRASSTTGRSSRRVARDDADRNLVPDAMLPGPLPDWKAPHLEPERLHVVECLPSDHLSRYRTELVLLGHRVSCTPKRQG